jgi:hypothetical protein
MLNSTEFANLIVECIKTSEILNEDKAESFAKRVIYPYLKNGENYNKKLAERKNSAFKMGDKIDESTPEAFAFGVQKALRKIFPKVPAGADKRDYDFYEDNKGFWYNFALKYYNEMTKAGLTTASSQQDRKKAIGNGMGKGSNYIHDSGKEGYYLANNKRASVSCFDY